MVLAGSLGLSGVAETAAKKRKGKKKKKHSPAPQSPPPPPPSQTPPPPPPPPLPPVRTSLTQTFTSSAAIPIPGAGTGPDQQARRIPTPPRSWSAGSRMAPSPTSTSSHRPLPHLPHDIDALLSATHIPDRNAIVMSDVGGNRQQGHRQPRAGRSGGDDTTKRWLPCQQHVPADQLRTVLTCSPVWRQCRPGTVCW